MRAISFSTEVEPLKQNQFGGTLGGPIRKDKAFFFGYYEGFRNRQGITRAAVVPTAEQRQGDFSKLTDPETGAPVPLINYLSGRAVSQQPHPRRDDQPDFADACRTTIRRATSGPSLFSSTEVDDQRLRSGRREDRLLSSASATRCRSGSATRRARTSTRCRSRAPACRAFPVGDDIATTLLTISETHQFSPYLVNSFRAGFFRHDFFFDKRFNNTPPRELGFDYDSTLDVATGPPFFIVNGYASVGDPITGPRDSAQNSFEFYDSLSWFSGNHSFKFGGEFRRTQINAQQGIASNGFFVFAPFPVSDPYANFLMGSPVVFFQAGGDMQRGMRNWDLAGYAQDEWRVGVRISR